MVLGLRPFLGVFVILCISFHPCRALDNSVLSWIRGFHSRNKTLTSNQLMECETLNFSLSPEAIQANNPSQGDISYRVLAVEPGGKATMSLVGHDPSSLHWTIQYPAGTQLFIALFDSFGTSLGVLPAVYTVTPSSTICLTKSESHGVSEATWPQISSSVFGHLLPCGSWEISFSGGKPPYSVSIVALKSGSVYNYSVPSGEHILSYTSSGELSGQVVVVLVRDANGMFATTSSIIDIAYTQDTPFVNPSDTFSKCRSAQPRYLSLFLREPPRPTTLRFRRSLPDIPHMQLSRNVVTINISHADTVIVAVCVSLGGTGIVAIAICVIIMYRRRQKILDAQDTLPRPFEVTVPAATTTSTSVTTRDLTSPPMLSNPRRIYSQSGGRCRFEVRRKEFSARTKPSRVGLAPTPTTTAPSQSQPGSSRSSRNSHSTRMQPHLSDESSSSNHAGPSSYRSPPRSWTHPHTPTPPGTQPQSGSRVQPEHSFSSLPTGAQSQHAAGVSASRSASVQERRSAKHAQWLSRSASELYSATSFEQRHRVPGYGSYPPSARYAHRHDEGEFHADMLSRPTNHMRHWHSASPVMDVQGVHSDSEEDVGAAIIFQHQDAGVMQELPPPYHKLVRSAADA